MRVHKWDHVEPAYEQSLSAKDWRFLKEHQISFLKYVIKYRGLP